MAHPVGRIIGEDLLFQFREPLDMGVDEVPVNQAVPRQDVHDSQGEGAVAAGADQENPVGGCGRGGLVGIDQPDRGPLLLRLVDHAEKMDAGGSRVDSPEDDEVALRHRVGVAGGGVPHDRLPPRVLGRRTDGPVEAGGPEAVEEGVTAVSLDEPHGPGVGVGEDGLRAMAADDLPPAAGDGRDRLVPGNRAELPGPLGPGADEGGGEAAGGVDRPLVVEHLGAEEAAGVGVLAVAGHPDGLPVLDLHQQAAGVGAVVGADGALDFGGHGNLLVLDGVLLTVRYRYAEERSESFITK